MANTLLSTVAISVPVGGFTISAPAELRSYAVAHAPGQRDVTWTSMVLGKHISTYVHGRADHAPGLVRHQEQVRSYASRILAEDGPERFATYDTVSEVSR